MQKSTYSTVHRTKPPAPRLHARRTGPSVAHVTTQHFTVTAPCPHGYTAWPRLCVLLALRVAAWFPTRPHWHAPLRGTQGADLHVHPLLGCGSLLTSIADASEARFGRGASGWVRIGYDGRHSARGRAPREGRALPPSLPLVGGTARRLPAEGVVKNGHVTHSEAHRQRGSDNMATRLTELTPCASLDPRPSTAICGCDEDPLTDP